MQDFVDETITKTKQIWDKEAHILKTESERLSYESNQRQDEIDALKKLDAGWNPFKGLSHVFKRMTQIPKHQKVIDNNAGRQQQIDIKVTELANSLIARICTVYVEEYPELKQTRTELRQADQDAQAELALFSQALSKANALMEMISRAYRECDQAESMEYIDAFSDNNAIDFLSHMETDEAINALKRVKSNLQSFKDYIDDNFEDTVSADLSSHRINALINSNALDFCMDFISDFAGNLMSLSNAADLSKAKRKLTALEHDLTPVKKALASDAKNAQAKAQNAQSAIARFRKDILNAVDAKYSGAYLRELQTHMTQIAIEQPVTGRKMSLRPR